MLTTIISGGQSGADIAGLNVAVQLGLKTGGTMPKGYKTLDGNRPEYAQQYGIVEHESDYYPPRTEANVKNSDGTVRFALNWNSRGEKCTKKYIDKHSKPYFDIDLRNPPDTKEFRAWLFTNNIIILNVAGNHESISNIGSIYDLVFDYLIKALS